MSVIYGESAVGLSSHDNTLFLVPRAVTSGIWEAAIVPALLPQYAMSYFSPSRSVARDVRVSADIVYDESDELLMNSHMKRAMK